jgi:hypothetical protein
MHSEASNDHQLTSERRKGDVCPNKSPSPAPYQLQINSRNVSEATHEEDSIPIQTEVQKFEFFMVNVPKSCPDQKKPPQPSTRCNLLMQQGLDFSIEISGVRGNHFFSPNNVLLNNVGTPVRCPQNGAE